MGHVMPGGPAKRLRQWRAAVRAFERPPTPHERTKAHRLGRCDMSCIEIQQPDAQPPAKTRRKKRPKRKATT